MAVGANVRMAEVAMRTPGPFLAGYWTDVITSRRESLRLLFDALLAYALLEARECGELSDDAYCLRDTMMEMRQLLIYESGCSVEVGDCSDHPLLCRDLLTVLIQATCSAHPQVGTSMTQSQVMWHSNTSVLSVLWPAAVLQALISIWVESDLHNKPIRGEASLMAAFDVLSAKLSRKSVQVTGRVLRLLQGSLDEAVKHLLLPFLRCANIFSVCCLKRDSPSDRPDDLSLSDEFEWLRSGLRLSSLEDTVGRLCGEMESGGAAHLWISAMVSVDAKSDGTKPKSAAKSGSRDSNETALLAHMLPLTPPFEPLLIPLPSLFQTLFLEYRLKKVWRV